MRVVADTNVLISGLLLKDIPVLRCAAAAHAHAIVSGDGHLLGLKEFRGISIVTPRVFLAALGL